MQRTLFDIFSNIAKEFNHFLETSSIDISKNTIYEKFFEILVGQQLNSNFSTFFKDSPNFDKHAMPILLQQPTKADPKEKLSQFVDLVEPEEIKEKFIKSPQYKALQNLFGIEEDQKLIDGIKSLDVKQVSDALKSGANPNLRYNGQSILHTVVELANKNKAYCPIVYYLVCAGASTGSKNANGKKLFDVTSVQVRDNINRGIKDRIPYYIAYKNSFNGAVKHIQKEMNKRNDVDVNCSVSHYGCTPLHLAVKVGRADVVELLIANGADKTAKDKEGKIPFALAKEDSIKALTRPILKRSSSFPGQFFIKAEDDVNDKKLELG
ncbi:ankyrin repeat domain-containing protein [Thiotrichales bacterium 19S9-12]|nr:ankyrin repeat domain-containing protein [Thiotrichales bacterium 19S9-11]MCF6811814.1 ankyrin repeat domain-containing protein [Thiotrichales bacterium 19S9-12]